MFLSSASLPQGKSVTLNLTDPESFKKTPVTIKEGVEYRCVLPFDTQRSDWAVLTRSITSVGITFKVNGEIINGLRYIQIVKRAGVKGTSHFTHCTRITLAESNFTWY